MNPNFEKDWLHIHIRNGTLYVFADSGHWRDTRDWNKAIQTTFQDLEKDCQVAEIEGDLMVRIPLKSRALVKRHTKFGMVYYGLGD